MDKQKFDALTRAFATGTSRRTAIKGIFGGAAAVTVAATRLDRAGAAECAPETVGDDCALPDACTWATCQSGSCVYEGGCGSCEVCDTLSGTCISECGACEYCEGGECVSDCGSCEDCVGGQCVNNCTSCEFCSEGTCYERTDDGICCGGVWVIGGQCCGAADCVGPVDTFCSSVACLDNICTNVPECPPNHFCCGLGNEGAYCAFCCNDDQCEQPGYCSEGRCYAAECVYDSDCPDCMVCGENYECAYLICELGEICCSGHECIHEDYCCKESGLSCGLLQVTGADGSPQNDCCDGLVCCDQWGDMGPLCAECCGDWDCPKGAWCNRGWCEWPEEECEHDKDCPKGTCCCKDGSCSGKCCDKPHPPKPPKPHKPHKPAPPASGGTVTTLPATGTGQESAATGMFGAAALGAAAALYAARKLRENPEAQTEE